MASSGVACDDGGGGMPPCRRRGRIEWWWFGEERRWRSWQRREFRLLYLGGHGCVNGPERSVSRHAGPVWFRLNSFKLIEHQGARERCRLASPETEGRCYDQASLSLRQRQLPKTSGQTIRRSSRNTTPLSSASTGRLSDDKTTTYSIFFSIEEQLMLQL
jgi:hypothetical protein